MIELPLAAKVIPLALAGMIALAPISSDLREAATREQVIKDGYTTKVIKDQVYKLPYHHESIIISEDIGIIKGTINKITDAGKKVWERVKP